MVATGNAKRPRAFHINKVAAETLSVIWRHNKKAWMTSALYTEWPESLNDQMTKNRCILLLLNNAPSHPNLKFSHVELMFLPPNLTSEVQPLDQGIIHTMKALYRKQMLTCLIAQADQEGTATQYCKAITVLHTIKWIAVAWKNVEVTTIQKCFRRCGVCDGEPMDENLQHVDIFAGTEQSDLDIEWTAEAEGRYVTCDEDEPCCEDAMDTVDDVADSVIKEATEVASKESPNDDSDGDDVMEVDKINVTVAKVWTTQDGLDLVKELLAFSYATSSADTELVFQLESIFMQQKSAERTNRINRLVQSKLVLREADLSGYCLPAGYTGLPM